MPKQRLALVCTSLNQLGGKNNHLKNIYHGLKDEYEVFIILSSHVEKELHDFMIAHGVDDRHLIYLDWRKKWFLLPFVSELARVYRDLRIDVVHTFQMQSDVFGGIAARWAGIEQLYSYYESKVITENDSWPKRVLYRTVNGLIKNWFVSTVVVSNGLKQEVEEAGFRTLGKVAVVHLGINVPPEVAAKTFPFERLFAGSPVIGTISRFSFEKALERIVEAAPAVLRRTPGARFLLIGKGPDEEKLRERVRSLGLESKFAFRPWAADVFTALEDIDIFVMTSLREGCPTALLEAMAVKRPIVASDIEGIRDLVTNGSNGLLVDTSDPAELAGAVNTLCSDPAGTVKMGQKGFDTVLNSFTIKAEWEALKRLYQQGGDQ